MPVHDWSRVDDGIFHDFHLAWIGELRRALNSGLLPADYYALGEQIAGGIGPDVLTLHVSDANGNGSFREPQGAVAVIDAPPKVRISAQTEMDEYAVKQRTLVIRHVSNHRIVSLIDILSHGNKSSQHALRALLDKACSAVAQNIHVLLIDLYAPSQRDPQGVHGLLWKKIADEHYERPDDKPLTLAAYAAGAVKRAFVEPVAVHDTLPDMPLFLTPDFYVNVPLEQTYMAAYEGVPQFYKDILESGN